MATIPTHYISKFTSGLRILQQQMATRFRDGVEVDTEPEIEGKRVSYDQLDATSMTPITDRHGKTQVTDDIHKRRWVTMAPAEKASMIDRADMRRILNNPTNSHVRNHSFAANRWLDDRIIEAFFAISLTGEEAGGTEAFPGSMQVASVAGGLVIDQLIDARLFLEEQENEEDDGMFKWFGALAGKQRRDLLKTTEFTNTDYASVKALVQGRVDTFLGFTFLKSERLAASGSDRRCPFWVKATMQAAISQDKRTFMDIIPERRHSVQIRTEVDEGATRKDEKGVVELLAAE